jgi:uncharacterized protein
LKILIDIGHPAHVHLFKNFALKMQFKGNSVLFTCREKEFILELLEHYGFQYKSLGKKYTSLLGKFVGMVEFEIKELFINLNYDPDIILSHGSVYIALSSFVLNTPHISFEDTFNYEQTSLYKPFTKAILTSTYAHPNMGSKNVRYKGYHELAYLHPKQFKPDPSILNYLGIKPEEKYFILRFVSWNASHDFRHKGITTQNKLILVQQLSKFGKVFISSERSLPVELKKYAFPIPSWRMHDAIAYCSLLIGESATMASEAAILGVPSIYLDNKGRLYTKEQQEKYGLVFNYSESQQDQVASIEKAIELAQQKDVLSEWAERRDIMLKEKIDVTSLLEWFVENWPESMKIMKEAPEYQERFK